jgi:hypothetical protein
VAESDAIEQTQRLRVAYLSDPNAYARALLRMRALQDLGHQVWHIPTVPLKPGSVGHVPLPLWRKIALKLGFHLDVTGAGRALAALARRQPLDLIWVDKGMSVQAGALRAAKAAMGAKALSFSEDDMALPHNRSRRWVRALDAYDLVVTTKIANIEGGELEALGARRVCYVTQAFDPHQHFPVPMDETTRQAFGGDLSFIGWCEEDRARSIHALAKAGLSVRVWGPGWQGKLDHPNVRIEGRWVVNTDAALDYSKTLAASKIGLGFLRKLNRDQHTSRTLEIPACGSLLLAERTPVHLAMFQEGVEAEFFASDEELVAKARYYLDHEDERRKVAQAGYERCLRDYSSVQQMARILTELAQAGLPTAGSDAP